jgi:SfnB family sulfur acquisition oxidoreductase
LSETRTANRISCDAEAIAVARRLAAELAADAARRDRDRVLPRDAVERMSRAGLWAITVPRDHGGAGVSAATVAEVTAILAEADGSIGQIPQNHFYMVEAIRLDGSAEQKATWFGRVLDGDRIGNALAEVGTRTHTDFRTTLLPEGDGFRLDGRKFYSTGALFAHWIAAVAKDADGRRTIALVPRDAPGLTLIDDWSAFGQRTTGSGTTLFEGVRVDPAAIIPHHRAFARPTPMGALAQIIHAAVDLGIARAAIAAGRREGSSDPALIGLAGELMIGLHGAEAMIGRAGRLIDIATAAPDLDTVTAASVAVAEAKVLTTEIALRAGNALFDLLGPAATEGDQRLDRFWRDARTHTLHDPVRWKLHAIGNWTLNGVPPPRHGAI